jgi:hypothetical protein
MINVILILITSLIPVAGTPFFDLASTPIFDRVVDVRLFRFGNWVFNDGGLLTQVQRYALMLEPIYYRR